MLQGFKMFHVTVRAIENAESVSLLLAHGADPAVPDNQVYTFRQPEALTISITNKSFGMTLRDMINKKLQQFLAVEAKSCHAGMYSQ